MSSRNPIEPNVAEPPSTTTLPFKEKQYDCLAVFQAVPLVYVSSDDDQLHPLQLPAFKDEQRDILMSCREAREINAEIDVVFEPANVDRLSAFLARGQSSVMHFSGHGYPSYLGIEIKGVMQPLFIKDLRRFMAAGKHHVKLVFVAACHSRPAGEFFIAAGVKHVVCCHQLETMTDVAAIVFARNFYRALALRNTVKVSFHLAREAVRLDCPEKEAEKFLLLPLKTEEDPYHDVQVFYTSNRTDPVVACPPHHRRTGDLPPAPQLLLGRELHIFRLVEKLLGRARLVSLTGHVGVGRSSLAKYACNYMLDRISDFEEFFWIPNRSYSSSHGCSVSNDLTKAYSLLEANSVDSVVLVDLVHGVERHLKETRALITIDARKFPTRTVEKLGLLLDDLLLGLEYTSVLVICPSDSLLRSNQHLTEHFQLPKLDLESTVRLFGISCPLVSGEYRTDIRTQDDIVKLLVKKGTERILPESKGLSKRTFDILSRIGKGNPAEIRRTASQITESAYKELLQIGERPEICRNFETRYQLEIKIQDTFKRMVIAENEQNYLAAHHFRELLEELCWCRGDILSFTEMKTNQERLLSDLNSAVTSRDYVKAFALDVELQELKKRIEIEKRASIKEPMNLETNAAESIEEGMDLAENCPPELEQTSESSGSFCDGLEGFVGVEFSATNMNENIEWNEKVIKSQDHIEEQLKKLIRYGSAVHGNISLQLKHLTFDGSERVVVQLECEIELRDNLRERDLARVKDICHNLASLLRDAGATEKQLERIMIGSLWKGSLEVLVNLPSTVVNMLYNELANSNQRLQVGSDDVFLVAISPAIHVRGPYRLIVALNENEQKPDAFLFSEHDIRLIFPTCAAARTTLFAGGVKYGQWSKMNWTPLLPSIQHVIPGLCSILPSIRLPSPLPEMGGCSRAARTAELEVPLPVPPLPVPHLPVLADEPAMAMAVAPDLEGFGAENVWRGKRRLAIFAGFAVALMLVVLLVIAFLSPSGSEDSTPSTISPSKSPSPTSSPLPTAIPQL